MAKESRDRSFWETFFKNIDWVFFVMIAIVVLIVVLMGYWFKKPTKGSEETQKAVEECQ